MKQEEQAGCEIPTLVKGGQRLGMGQGVRKKQTNKKKRSPPPMLLSHVLTPQSWGAKECKPVDKTHPDVLASEAQEHKALSAQQRLSELRLRAARHCPGLRQGHRRTRCTLP